MAHRTTILLDEKTRTAAQDLARAYECSVSEAIRRAVVDQRRLRVGISGPERAERQRTLRRAFELFEGHDAAAEVAALKDQNRGF